MMICKASDTEKSGLGMRRVLTQNQVDGLARGAETDGRTLCYAHRAADGNSVQPSTRFGQTSQTPLQLIPVNGWLVMSAIRCIMRTTSPLSLDGQRGLTRGGLQVSTEGSADSLEP